jgi:GntR family transcriptional regulator / MocR family aminotransferase
MLRPWSLRLPLRQGDALPLHLQITQAVVEEIRSGRLQPGDALPGSRVLAAELSINRKTVVLAYEELQAQGWIEQQPRRGAFISARLLMAQLQVNEPTTPADLPLKAVSPELAGYLAATHQEKADGLAFSDGIPDTRLIPYDVLARAHRHAMVALVRHNQLGYGDPAGTTELRTSIADMLRMERGLNVSAEQVCVVRGSQMGIYLAARLLGEPGSCAVFELLSYPPAREAFRSCGATVLSVEQDEYGLLPEALEQLCREHPVRVVYVTPHHQFPTTVMLPADRRLRLLALAEQYGFAIIEDDYDHEFHYLHSPVPPLASLDNKGRVLHIGSLSKVLAPGLRLGYIVASKRVIDRCAAEIMLIDRQGNPLTELAVSELMSSGELQRHIRRALKIYHVRRNFVATCLTEHLSGMADFQLPAGGIALWLRFAPAIDMQQLVLDCARQGLHITNGQVFSQDATPTAAIRLGFGHLTEKELETGVQRLAAALKRQLPR